MSRLLGLLGLPFRVAGAFLGWWFARLWRAVLFVLLLFGGLVLGTVEAWHYASSPSFCRSCHHMEPYYESWSRSSHAKVPCIGCHFEPGLGNEFHAKFLALKQLASAVTGSYSPRPFAEVSDRSCLRSGCHSLEKLHGRILFSKRGILFPHDVHLERMPNGIKLACVSCHAQLTLEKHMEVDLSSCFLCHFKGSRALDGTPDPMEQCGVCHGPPRAKIVRNGREIDHRSFLDRGMRCGQCHLEVVRGDGAAGRDRCLACHDEPQKLARYGETEFLHLAHATRAKLNCYLCHERIEHRFERPAAGHAPPAATADCRRCHLEPHDSQAAFFAGRGAVRVKGKPDPMQIVGLDCTACHGPARRSRALEKAHAGVSAAALARGSCNACHGQGYSEFVRPFMERIEKLRASLTARLARIDAEFKKIEAAGGYVAKDAYKTARETKSDLVFLARAVAIHNPFYAVSILLQADRDLRSVERDLGLSPGELPPPAVRGKECVICHDGLPRPKDVKLADGKIFPHERAFAAGGPECTACHKGKTHPAKPVIPYEACDVCHKK